MNEQRVDPFCIKCGYRLGGILGTTVLVCTFCGAEFRIMELPQQTGLDAFLDNPYHTCKPDSYSDKNLEEWK